MKKFFFILCISKFLTGSDNHQSLTQEGIIKIHLTRICARILQEVPLAGCSGQRCQELVKSEYLNEIVYRALRGGNHLTKKEPLKFDNPVLYEQLYFTQNNVNLDEELPLEMQEDIRLLYQDLQK